MIRFIIIITLFLDVMCINGHSNQNIGLFYGIDLTLDTTIFKNKLLTVERSVYHYDPFTKNKIETLNLIPINNDYFGYKMENIKFHLECQYLNNGIRKELVLHIYPNTNDYNQLKREIISYFKSQSNRGFSNMELDSINSYLSYKINNFNSANLAYYDDELYLVLTWYLFEAK